MRRPFVRRGDGALVRPARRRLPPRARPCASAARRAPTHPLPWAPACTACRTTSACRRGGNCTARRRVEPSRRAAALHESRCARSQSGHALSQHQRCVAPPAAGGGRGRKQHTRRAGSWYLTDAHSTTASTAHLSTSRRSHGSLRSCLSTCSTVSFDRCSCSSQTTYCCSGGRRSTTTAEHSGACSHAPHSQGPSPAHVAKGSPSEAGR